MKTEMQIKTDRKSLFAKSNLEMKTDEKRRRKMSAMRGVACAGLLFLLGAGGYFGADRKMSQGITVPVSVVWTNEEASGLSSDEIAERYEMERQKEIMMLMQIIEHPKADESARENAFIQKMELVRRMEWETQIRAALGQMGYGQTGAVCASECIVVVLSQGQTINEGDAARITETVCSITGGEAGDVKIILAKK